LLSFSAHKFHGPKGIGGLYIRPGIELKPMLLGGGQEGGLRSGTTNTPALAGLSVAASEALDVNYNAIRDLRESFETRLLQVFPDALIHSQAAPRLPNTSCFSLSSILGTDVVEFLASEGVIVSAGAACSAGALRPSKTLQSMGVDHEVAERMVRVSFSRFSSEHSISRLFEVLDGAVIAHALR